MRVQRFDVAPLRPARRMDDGRVICDAYFTRCGVFRYPQPDGTVIRELRHPDDVFDAESLRSFGQVPVTNTHPSIGLIDAKNARKFAVGATGERVERDGDKMRGSIVVYDAATVEDMEGGKLELSNGYRCDLEWTAGVDPVYGAYDARQRKIRGNHVALVDRGRAGSECRARMDGEALPDDTVEKPRGLEQSGGAHRSIELRDRSGVSSSLRMDKDEALRAVNAQLKEQQARADEAESQHREAQKRLDAAEGQLEVANKKIGALEAQIAANSSAIESENVRREKDRADKAETVARNLEARFDGEVRQRADLQHRAAAIMGPRFDMRGMSDRLIRVEVIKRLDATQNVGDAVADGKIEGIFDALVDGYFKNARNLAEISEALAVNDAYVVPKKPDDPDDKKPGVSRRDLWKNQLPTAARFRGQKGQ